MLQCPLKYFVFGLNPEKSFENLGLNFQGLKLVWFDIQLSNKVYCNVCIVFTYVYIGKAFRFNTLEVTFNCFQFQLTFDIKELKKRSSLYILAMYQLSAKI